MSDDTAGFEAQVVAGPIGPDSLRLPGSPARLRQAVQGLHDLVSALDRTAQELHGTDAKADAPGKVARALGQVAERAGGVLDRDNDALRDLAGALDHLSNVLREAQSATLPELRSRWHAARVDLADAVESDAREGGHTAHGPGHGAGHGGGHGSRVAAGSSAVEPGGGVLGPRDSHQLARHLDGEVIDDYEHLFRRWLGASFNDPGDGASAQLDVVAGGPLDEGMRRYKQTLRAILEDYADGVRRVETADQDVASKLPRREHDVLAGAHDGAAPASGSSSAEDVQRLAEGLQHAATALQDAARSLEDIRLDVRGGRMLPPGERIGSNDGFRRDWDAHLEALRGNLDQARQHSDSVLRRLQQLEEEGAHAIRRAGRADG